MLLGFYWQTTKPYSKIHLIIWIKCYKSDKYWHHGRLRNMIMIIYNLYVASINGTVLVEYPTIIYSHLITAVNEWYFSLDLSTPRKIAVFTISMSKLFHSTDAAWTKDLSSSWDGSWVHLLSGSASFWF